MSERLTDNELAHFEKDLSVHREVIHPDVLASSTFTSRVSFVQMAAMIAELRERRAADLSDEERGALRWARELVSADESRSNAAARLAVTKSALAVLDKLLAASGKRK